MKFLSIVVLSLLCQIGSAQYGGSPGFSRLAGQSMNQYIQRQELRSVVNRRMLMNRTNRLSNTQGEVKRPTKNVAKGPSSFVEKQPILPQKFIESLENKTEEEQKVILSRLDSYLTTYKETAFKDGFPTNDLAYAFNYYLVNNYAVYVNYFDANKHQKRVMEDGNLESDAAYKERINLNITIPIEQKIYNQYKAYFNTDATVKKMTDVQKQLFVELLIAITNFTFENYSTALSYNNTVLLQEASNTAKGSLETFFGVSIDKIKITEDGLQVLD